MGDPRRLDPDSNIVMLKDNTGGQNQAEIEIVSGRVNDRKYENKRIPVSEGSRRR